MGVRMLLEFVFTPAELKILDDPLPFSRTKERQDKEEEAGTHDISTDVSYHEIRFFLISSFFVFKLSSSTLKLKFRVSFYLKSITKLFLVLKMLTLKISNVESCES
jgi:hypothetical protein